MKSFFLSLLTCFVAFVPEAFSQPAGKPNIIFIYTDDQAIWSLGVSGHPDASTPNLDRLARQGAYFLNNLTTTPVCSPSRASLMTSRFGTEVGITDYINPGRQPNLGLDPGYVTWAEVLSAGGYRTGFVGKWHLGTQDRYLPTEQGYDEFAGFRTGGSTSKDPTVEVNGKRNLVKGYTPDILARYAMDFVRRNRENPFLVSLHFWAPHANTTQRTPDGDRTWLPLSDADWTRFSYLDPLIPNPDYPNLDIPRVKRMLREYLASVASVDRNVGRLMTLLDEMKLARKTIVIFSSDHGYSIGHNGIWHKGNGRWILKGVRWGEAADSGTAGHEVFQEYRTNLWDKSLRVPAIVRWPGVVEPGTRIEEVTSNLDWYPTIVEMAGFSLPPGELIRGRSLLPLLKNEPTDWDNEFYGEYSQDSGGVEADLRCLRTPEWKLVRDFHNAGRDELYHLARDPEEHSNLIQTQDPLVQKVKAALNERLLSRMKEIKDPVLP